MTEEFEGSERDFADFGALAQLLSSLRSGEDTQEMVDFRRFFDQLERPPAHFGPDEFMILGPSNANPNSACFEKNGFPAQDLWDNVVPLVNAMDAIRAKLGHPVRITNCYRNEDYNGCVGGVPGSFHRLFKAADFVCASGVSGDWAAAANSVRDDGVFMGGVGIYNSFVHVDVRGTPANWDKRT